MKKAVIFDFDGVIYDTDPIHIIAWNEILTKENIPFNIDVFKTVIGKKREDQFRTILDSSNTQLSQDEFDRILKLKNNRYLELIKDLNENDLDKDVLYTLKELKKKNIKIALATSSKNAKNILGMLKIKDYFDVIVDGYKVINGKPDKEAYAKALKELNVDGDDAIAIEDSLLGIDSASDAGIETVGIRYASNYDKTSYPSKKVSDVLKYLE